MPVQTALVGAGGAVKSIFVVLSSMAPFVENKGSILLAAALNVKWYLAYIGTSIGSFLPVPFLLRAGDRGMQRLRRFGPAARVLDQVEAFSRQHEAFLKRHGYLALALIISVPFTGIGCWAGVLLSNMLGLDKKHSTAAILAGIIVSGFLTTAGAYGLFLGIRSLIRLW